MTFPDITKASGAVKRVFSVIDRVPAILPNFGTGKSQACVETVIFSFNSLSALALCLATYQTEHFEKLMLLSANPR